MRRPTQKQKPRKAQLASFPAPTAGLISNRNLSIPTQQGLMPGAAVLRNFFPTASSVILRRGSTRWAVLPSDGNITAMWTYNIGAISRMFASTADGIWDISSEVDPGFILATEALDYIATDVVDEVIGEPGADALDLEVTGGDWSVLQFSTAGGTYLIGVNGVDTGFIYDGTTYYPYVDGGVSSLGFDASVTPFVGGEVVTGGTSGATATVFAVDGADLIIIGITGTFQDNEALTGSIAGAATADGTVVSGVAPGLTGVDSADLSFVWAYKQRVYFVEANTLNVWYLPVDQVGGTAVVLPLGGVFNLGGALQWGQTWSLNSGGDGGLSDQCVFTTTEGEVAAYQGLSPDDALTWSKVGIYRIGRPMGKKAFIRAGGDLIIASTVGFVSLAAAAERDVAALGAAAVSYPIEDDWALAVQQRGAAGWNCKVWPDGQMVLVAPPTPIDQFPVVFVANSNTGAWCTFTNWTVTALEIFLGRVFYGSTAGNVVQGYVGGSDQGLPYTGDYMSLFDDLKSPGSRKIAKLARVLKRGSYDAAERVTARFDYDESLPAPPDAPTLPTGNEWDNGIWNESIWNAERGAVVTARWQSVGGSGSVVSAAVQVTSGSVAPLDIEITRVDMMLETCDTVT